MDPDLLITTFPTIVQLLGMFKSERKDQKEADEKKFLEWLEYHRHEDVKNLICNTAGLQTEILNVLKQDNAIILSQLGSINITLAKLLSHVEGFRGITKILLPNFELSDQAISILRQFVESEEKMFIFGDLGSRIALQLENGEPLQFSERRFVADDLSALVECQLLTRRQNRDGSLDLFGITRSAVNYIKMLSNDPVAGT